MELPEKPKVAITFQDPKSEDTPVPFDETKRYAELPQVKKGARPEPIKIFCLACGKERITFPNKLGVLTCPQCKTDTQGMVQIVNNKPA